MVGERKILLENGVLRLGLEVRVVNGSGSLAFEEARDPRVGVAEAPQRERVLRHYPGGLGDGVGSFDALVPSVLLS